VNHMFIRFVCGEIDEDSHVSAGLFCAAFDLIKDEKLSDHDYEELADLMRWFRLNLKGHSNIGSGSHGARDGLSAGSSQMLMSM